VWWQLWLVAVISESSIVSAEPQADTFLHRKRISELSIISAKPQANTFLHRKHISELSTAYNETSLSFLPRCKGQPTAYAAAVANATITQRLRHHPLDAQRGAVVPHVYVIRTPVIVPVVVIVPIGSTVVQPAAAAVARVAIVIAMMMQRRQ
jgi:hypothetical protein